MEKQKYQNIIFFDELCPFCTAWVPFVINHSKISFYISPLSSKYAQKRLGLTNQIDSINFESLVIIQGDEIFEKGAAVKLVIRNLTGILYIFRGLLFLPDPAINTIYKLFAKNRTKMFGRHSSCPVNILDNEKFLYE
tara:strand:- start:11 stop:421 length:411 start_codon:yes stop_codon:yes gene_type:complete